MCNTKQKKKRTNIKVLYLCTVAKHKLDKKKIKGLHWAKCCVINNIPPDKKKKVLTESESKPLWKVLHC